MCVFLGGGGVFGSGAGWRWGQRRRSKVEMRSAQWGSYFHRLAVREAVLEF